MSGDGLILAMIELKESRELLATATARLAAANMAREAAITSGLARIVQTIAEAVEDRVGDKLDASAILCDVSPVIAPKPGPRR